MALDVCLCDAFAYLSSKCVKKPL
ncbi:hypothetical protein ACUAW6_003556 [Vibrio cholerae]